jgi:hypothetical protein
VTSGAPGEEAATQPRPGPVRRALVVVAVVATLAGLPLVLLGGALLRRAGVAPSMPNAAALRLVLLDKGFDCADPVAEVPPAGGAASALACRGDDGAAVRVAAYRNPAAREAAPAPPGLAVYGANWRIEVPTTARPLAARLADALTGRVSPPPRP